MRSVRCGCIRTRSHSPAVSGAGLSQMLLDTPSRPKPATRPARRSVSHVVGGQPELDARPGRRGRRAAAEWPSVYGDLRSTKRAIAASAVVALRRRQPHRQCRLAVDHRVPRIELVDAVEDLVDVAGEQLARGRDRTAWPIGARPPRRRRRPRRCGAPPRRTRPAGRCATRPGSPHRRGRPASRGRPNARRTPRGRRGPTWAGRARSPSERAMRAWLAIIPSSVLVARRRRSRPRPAAGAVACCRSRAVRSMRPRSASADGSWSYFVDFAAMSSPNQWACS